MVFVTAVGCALQKAVDSPCHVQQPTRSMQSTWTVWYSQRKTCVGSGGGVVRPRYDARTIWAGLKANGLEAQDAHQLWPPRRKLTLTESWADFAPRSVAWMRPGKTTWLCLHPTGAR
eukprot:4239734-Amphidinium_carterae.1